MANKISFLNIFFGNITTLTFEISSNLSDNGLFASKIKQITSPNEFTSKKGQDYL